MHLVDPSSAVKTSQLFLNLPETKGCCHWEDNIHTAAGAMFSKNDGKRRSADNSQIIEL